MVTSIDRQETKIELKPGWRMVRFDQMAECVTDRVDDPSEANVDYYVGLEHLDSESLKIRRWGIPDDVTATKLRFKPGDIIFGRRRAYQRKVAVAEFEGICSAHALVLRAREEVILKDFLPFFMQSNTFFERAMTISVGSLSPTINWKTLAQQEFALPPKDEQRRIAEILWAADEAIGKYENLLAVTKDYKRILIKESYLSPEISFTTLGNHAGLVTSGSRGWAQYYAPDGCIFIRVTNLTRENVDMDLRDLEFVQLPAEAEGTRTRVLAKDILISITADLGRIAVVPANFPEAYVNQHVALVRLQTDTIDPYFVAYYLLSSEGQKQFFALNDAGTKAGMNLQNVRRLRIPYAEPEHQKRFVQVFRGLDSRIQQIQEYLDKYMQLKRSLLSLLKPHHIS